MVRGKQWCYDSGLHVPLIVRWPKSSPAPTGYRPETVNDDLVSLIDVSATTVALADVDKPEKMQGRILFGEQRDEARAYTFAARDRCDETVFRIRTVRDERYRYIRNYMPERPFGQLNRYKEASYPVLRLMRRLHARGELTPAASRTNGRRPPQRKSCTIWTPTLTKSTTSLSRLSTPRRCIACGAPSTNGSKPPAIKGTRSNRRRLCASGKRR